MEKKYSSIKCVACGTDVVRKSGRQKYCDCCKKKIKKNQKKVYYANNIEKIKAYRVTNKNKFYIREKKYREKNREKISHRNKEWSTKNREKLLEFKRNWRKKNKDKITEWKKEYREKNREKCYIRESAWKQKNANKCSVYGKEYRLRNILKLTENNSLKNKLNYINKNLPKGLKTKPTELTKRMCAIERALNANILTEDLLQKISNGETHYAYETKLR